MRQETNNEMDLLLRRLSRRGDDARDGETGPRDRHLDVDELSSYAQNALPAATRARYTEHLSECGSCRKIVTELALSLGAATAAAPMEAGLAPTGLKAFLASLFSPMVLRYAVPALGVIVVMVVGFVALRRQQREDFVAQVTVEQQKQPVSEPVEPGFIAPGPSPVFSHDQQAKAENQQSPVDQRSERKRDAGVNADAAKGPGAAAGTAAAPLRKSETDEIKQTETRPTDAEPSPAAPKTATEEASKETSKDKKAEAPPKKQPATSEFAVDAANANKPANEAAARRVTEVPVQNRGYQELHTLRPAVRAGAAAAEDKQKTEKSEKDTTETRSVAGRTFKKERGIWIDTAYDSSTTPIRNLARGSESFRALVADEPAINTIAEQLDGEVIVVWKGRAYHIR